MSTTVSTAAGGALRVGWWGLFLICLLYGVYALAMGGVEVLALLGLMDDAPQRAAPYVFVIHALTGGVALIIGPLQFQRRILAGRRDLHRLLGRVYVGAMWLTSAAGLWSAALFDRSLAGRVALAVIAVLLFATTTVALQRIRARRVVEHREWMIRSFALALFFVTFSVWVPGLAATPLPEAIGYPLAVFLSWVPNLLLAEAWIRRGRRARQARNGARDASSATVEG